MKLSPSEQEAVIALLMRIYGEICAIETEFRLAIGAGDFRPRIDYFHDAIRALSSGDRAARKEGGRLCVERLAYDLSCLRYIQSRPLSPFMPGGGEQSAGTDVVALNQTPAPIPKRPDRQTKEQLVELYQHYGVLFAALLKPTADKDCDERVHELYNEIKDISAIIAAAEGLLSGKGNGQALMMAVGHIEDAGLRAELLAFLQGGKAMSKDALKKLIALLKDRIKKNDKRGAAVEQSHMDYSINQLALFENSRDLIKKMAVQGMNLVGNFVAAAISQAQQGRGR